QAAVEINSLGIRLACARWLNPRPRNRETVAVEIQRSCQRDVFTPAMIAVAGDVAGVAVLDLAGSMREAVPNGFALAVFVPCTFDLVRGGGCSPPKVLWEGSGTT